MNRMGKRVTRDEKTEILLMMNREIDKRLTTRSGKLKGVCKEKIPIRRPLINYFSHFLYYFSHFLSLFLILNSNSRLFLIPRPSPSKSSSSNFLHLPSSSSPIQLIPPLFRFLRSASPLSSPRFSRPLNYTSCRSFPSFIISLSFLFIFPRASPPLFTHQAYHFNFSAFSFAFLIA